MSFVPAGMLRSLSAIVLTFSAGLLFAQGSLTPPAGPPAPVMKTLSEVEPRIAVQSLSGVAGDCQYLIAKRGSYYLTGNINGISGANGIHVTTDSVTIDLNGYSVVGVPGSKEGILASFNLVTIRNGAVRDWGNGGLTVGFYAVVENVTAYNNTGFGIIGSFYSAIRNCQVYQNTSVGVAVSTGSSIDHCLINSNGGGGISLSNNGGRISECTIQYNTGRGITMSSGGDWQIANNTIYSNTLNGISAQGHNQIINNVINSNGASGGGTDAAGIFLSGGNNYVEGNHLQANKYGIYASNTGGETVIHNVILHSTTSNINGNGGNNTATFGPIATTAAGMTTPAHNLSIFP